MNRLIMIVILAGSTWLAPSAGFAQTVEQKAAMSRTERQELQKLMNAHGQGEMSAKEYYKRKEALLQRAIQAAATRELQTTID
jgi:hypothetical protein